MLGVSITTLRRWEADGKLAALHTAGGQRRYDLAKLKPELFHCAPSERKTIAYARVSSHDPKDDLDCANYYLKHSFLRNKDGGYRQIDYKKQGLTQP